MFEKLKEGEGDILSSDLNDSLKATLREKVKLEQTLITLLFSNS